MKKILLLILVLLVAIPAKLSYGINITKKLSSLNTKFICVVDFDSGRVLYEKNSKSIVPMASTTKIMTAIIALENSDIYDVVTVSKRASSIHGSTLGLKNGQKVTMEELLYGLMLRSGNDCSIAIAEHIAGSVENFTTLMDSKAFNIGAFDTHFSTPHGLDADGHFTTAFDLALITRYAMCNDFFNKIVSSKDITINGVGGLRNIHNINKILWKSEGADGVKTGYTGKAGKCLVSSAIRNGRRTICVTLDSQNRWEDSDLLLNYGFENYKNEFFLERDQYDEYVDISGGNKDKVKVEIDYNYKIPLADEENSDISIERIIPERMNAPVYKGQQVGVLILRSKDKKIISIPYRAGDTIKENIAKNYFQNIIQNIKSSN